MSLDPLACDFCGKTVREVTHLIAGPSVFICDECIELSVEILIDMSTTDTWRRVAFAASRQKLRELFGART